MRTTPLGPMTQGDDNIFSFLEGATSPLPLLLRVSIGAQFILRSSHIPLLGISAYGFYSSFPKSFEKSDANSQGLEKWPLVIASLELCSSLPFFFFLFYLFLTSAESSWY